MAKKKEERRPSREEFLAVIDSEFGFLVTQEGYRKKVTDQFKVEFTKGENSLIVMGESYGLSATVKFRLKDRAIPWFRLLPQGAVGAPKERTDSPQLDDLRRYAGWFREDLRGLLRGEPAFLERVKAALADEDRLAAALKRSTEERKRGDFFGEADKLFKAKKYAECVRHLGSGSYPLSATWKAKREYAKGHS